MKQAPVTKENECQSCGIDLYAVLGKEAAKVRECPCCHFQPSEGDTGAGHRDIWIRDGMPWRSPAIRRPKDWDPEQRISRMALAVTLSKVKGRPPRMVIL